MNMMAFGSKFLFLLLLLQYTASLDLCDLREEKCDEYANYSFSEFIADSYTMMMGYIGPGETNANTNRDNYGIIDEEAYTISEEDEKMIDMFLQHSKGIAKMVDKGKVLEVDPNELSDKLSAVFAGMTDEEPNLDVAADSDKHVNEFEQEYETMNGDFFKQVMDMAKEMGKEDEFDMDLNGVADILADVLGDKTYEEPERPADSDFEYLPMEQLDVGDIGQEKIIELPDGRKTTVRTLAKQPGLLEIDDFLTAEECDQIVDTAIKKKPQRSSLFVKLDDRISGNYTSDFRNSKSTTLGVTEIDEKLLRSIHERISAITNVPTYVIEGSEPIAIGQYDSGGYYHAHLDANEASRKSRPCCFQTPCKAGDGKKYEGADCCTMCRYATFLYYLNDVEAGGETAFPFAGMALSEMLKTQFEQPRWGNLSENCHNAKVVVKPKKGKAIFWYNTNLDSKGYLSGVNKRSFHGGCDVKQGTKWIATNWISFPIYEHRYLPSVYRDVKQSYRRHLETLKKDK